MFWVHGVVSFLLVVWNPDVKNLARLANWRYLDGLDSYSVTLRKMNT